MGPQPAITRILALLVALLLVSSSVAAESVVAPLAGRPEVWIMPPPWPGDGEPLRQMLRRPEEWAQTRRLVRGIGYWPWLLNQHFHDDDLRALFAGLKAWNLELGFEVPVVKAANWGGDGKPLDAAKAFEQMQRFATRFQPLGMPQVAWFAFDEPLYAARHVVPSALTPADRMARGIAETAAFLGMLRRVDPRSRLGLIEPFPALTFAEIVQGVEGVQRACGHQGIQGLDFLRLDVDWDRMDRGREAGWADVKRLEDHCRRQGIAFSLIYWAADEPRLARAGQSNPGTWLTGILNQKTAYAQAGGTPDQVVVESWLHVPASAVPESDPHTFTGSVLEFLKKP